jgi:hypothetical protein
MKIPIVKNYRSTVGARLDIDLDGKASLDRLVYGRKRVLGADLAMKSAVGNGGSNKPGRGRHRANLPHRLPCLVAGELLDSAGMPASLEGRCQPDIHNSQRHFD